MVLHKRCDYTIIISGGEKKRKQTQLHLAQRITYIVLIDQVSRTIPSVINRKIELSI